MILTCPYCHEKFDDYPERGPCSAYSNGECSNGFIATAPCAGTAGTPPCLKEELCGRLYPITGDPLKERIARDDNRTVAG